MTTVIVPSFDEVEMLVEQANSALMDILGYDNSNYDWHQAGGDGFRVLDPQVEVGWQEGNLAANEILPQIPGIQTVILDVSEYVYLLPITCVPQLLIGHIECVLNTLADNLPYLEVDDSVDDAHESLTEALQKLQQMHNCFQSMNWVSNLD